MKVFRKKIKNRLLIRLSATKYPVQWCLRRANGSLAQGENWPAHHVLQHAHITVLVPSARLLFREVSVRRTSRQALQWALETFTLSEPSDLHLTLLQREKQRHHLIAVEKEQLESWLSQLDEQGIQADRLMPDILGLEVGQAVQVGNEWVVRDRLWQGYSATSLQRTALESRRAILGEISQLEPGAAALAGAFGSRVNMLHGEFARHAPPPLRAGWMMWALAGCVAVALIGTPLFQGMLSLYNGWQYQREGRVIYQTLYQETAESLSEQEINKRLSAPAARRQPDSLLTALAQEKDFMMRHADAVSQLHWTVTARQLQLQLTAPVSGEVLPVHRGTRYTLSDDNKTLTVTYLP